MKSKFLACLFVLFSTYSFAQTADNIIFEEYFPLKNGDTLLYNWYYTHEGQSPQKATDTVVCHEYKVDNYNFFYFKKKAHKKDEFIGPNSFTHGVCYYADGALRVCPIRFEDNLQKIEANYFDLIYDRDVEVSISQDYFFTFFPREIIIGKIYSHVDGKCIRQYICVGFEDVKVEDEIIRHCLKFETKDIWPNTQYLGSIWFAKGIGKVKQIPGLGNEEVIDSKSIPN